MNQLKGITQTHDTAVQVNLWQSVLKKALTEASSSASQTIDSYLSIHHHHQHHHDNSHLMTSSERHSDMSVGTTPISCPLCCESSQEQLSLELSDLATQTEDCFSSPTPLGSDVPPQPHFNLSDLATQTVNLSTMTTQHGNHLFSFSDLATQTTEEDIAARVSSNLDEHVHVGFEPASGSAELATPSSFQSQGIQTQPQPTNELGTQTLCHILHSDFSHLPSSQCQDCSELHHHHDFNGELGDYSLVDFGTQTTLQLPLDCSGSSVSDFGTQTISDGELSDLVRELSSEGLQHMLPPECMDFGTQTLESEFAGIDCLDFGVQTSFGLQLPTEHQDQSSQTLD